MRWIRVQPTSFWFALLALLFVIRTASVANIQSATFDEPFHIAGGLSYWRLNDYRMHPENGVLAQRLITLTLAADKRVPLPDWDHPAWARSTAGHLGRDLIHAGPVKPMDILFQARSCVIAISLACLFIVFYVSRHWFGNMSAIVSTFLFSMDPLVLAHSSLATSDMCATLFLTLSVLLFASCLKQLTWARLCLFTVALAAAVCSKYSAFVLGPVIIVAVVIRAALPIVLEMGSGPDVQSLNTVRKRLFALSAAISLAAIGCLALVWVNYGLRFRTVSDPVNHASQPSISWSRISTTSVTSTMVRVAKNYRLAPEAFLYGFEYAKAFSKNRAAFLNGKYHSGGRASFFPIAFLIKTPITTLLLCLNALVFGGIWLFKEPKYWRNPYLYVSCLFVAIYSYISFTSGINIGLRHLLPLYPFLFMAIGWGLKSLEPLMRWRKWLIFFVVILVSIESISVHPNYLAYFNQLVGGSKNGYKHLIDSSLDWGQGLNQLKIWMEDNPTEEPTYFSYFGNAEPKHYGIDTHKLPSFSSLEELVIEPLLPGRYIVSASMLQPVYLNWGKGEWSPEYEQAYRSLFRKWQPELQSSAIVAQSKAPELKRELQAFDQFRFRRLTNYLLQRQPDHQIGYAIFVYNLSASDLDMALAFPGSKAYNE